MKVTRPFSCLFYLYFIAQIAAMYYICLTRVSHDQIKFAAWEVQLIKWIFKDAFGINLAIMAIRGLLLVVGFSLVNEVSAWYDEKAYP